MTSLFNNGTGFTLIELLVVVLIIGILTAVAVPQYEIAVNKARATELFVNVKHIKDMQEVYYLENGEYAPNCEELGIEIPGYVLNNKKNLVNESKFLTLDCNRAVTTNDPADPRVAGLFKDSLLSFEYKFAQRERNANQFYCYSSDEQLLRICKTYGTVDALNPRKVILN